MPAERNDFDDLFRFWKRIDSDMITLNAIVGDTWEAPDRDFPQIPDLSFTFDPPSYDVLRIDCADADYFEELAIRLNTPGFRTCELLSRYCSYIKLSHPRSKETHLVFLGSFRPNRPSLRGTEHSIGERFRVAWDEVKKGQESTLEFSSVTELRNFIALRSRDRVKAFLADVEESRDDDLHLLSWRPKQASGQTKAPTYH